MTNLYPAPPIALWRVIAESSSHLSLTRRTRSTSIMSRCQRLPRRIDTRKDTRMGEVLGTRMDTRRVVVRQRRSSGVLRQVTSQAACKLPHPQLLQPPRLKQNHVAHASFENTVSKPPSHSTGPRNPWIQPLSSTLSSHHYRLVPRLLVRTLPPLPIRTSLVTHEASQTALRHHHPTSHYPLLLPRNLPFPAM